MQSFSRLSSQFILLMKDTDGFDVLKICSFSFPLNGDDSLDSQTGVKNGRLKNGLLDIMDKTCSVV